MNSFDARARYTRMVIEQSFLKLLAEKPVSKITVTEICEKAQLNRATFYKHYLDVPNLLEKLEEDLFNKIRASFSAKDTIKLKEFLIRMMYYTRDNRDHFMALGSDNGDPSLMTKTFIVCYESAYPLLEKNMQNLKESERQMLYQYLSHGAGAALAWWVKDGMKEPPEEVAQFILSISSYAADILQDKQWRTKYQD